MKTNVKLVILLVISFLACTNNGRNEAYYRFPMQTWDRFNILNFDIPLEKREHPVTVTFFARYTRVFSHASLDFHVIMKTPNGEERIREYSMKIKNREGNFLHEFTGDSCEQSLVLNDELFISREGVLHVDVENLLPRLKTQGLVGVGIRVSK